MCLTENSTLECDGSIVQVVVEVAAVVDTVETSKCVESKINAANR
jgi:hypothetical protein